MIVFLDLRAGAAGIITALVAISSFARGKAMRFNPLEHPICFANPARLTISSWVQHLPFGMTLIDLLRPAIFVELGTHYGVSYCGFCQAVQELSTGTACYAVDGWEGDAHTGAYEEQVYEELRQHHDARYGDFSRLLKMNFDDALPYFAEGSIDLLHIDGYHTYEAVRHDFETWLPKLSTRAVVLIHDINERDREFGVWRYWDELRARYPTFALLHEHGLGVVAVGAQAGEALAPLLEATPEEQAHLREFFFRLGSRISLQMQEETFVSRLQHVRNLQELVKKREAELDSTKTYIASLTAALEQKQQEIGGLQQQIGAMQAQLNASPLAKLRGKITPRDE